MGGIVGYSLGIHKWKVMDFVYKNDGLFNTKRWILYFKRWILYLK